MDWEQIAAVIISALAAVGVIFFRRATKKPKTSTPPTEVHDAAQAQLDQELEKIEEQIEDVTNHPKAAEEAANLLRNRRR